MKFNCNILCCSQKLLFSFIKKLFTNLRVHGLFTIHTSNFYLYSWLVRGLFVRCIVPVTWQTCYCQTHGQIASCTESLYRDVDVNFCSFSDWFLYSGMRFTWRFLLLWLLLLEFLCFQWHWLPTGGAMCALKTRATYCMLYVIIFVVFHFGWHYSACFCKSEYR